MGHTILIHTDFSKVSNNAINHGAEIAKHMGAKLVILHVVNADSLSFLKKNKLDSDYIDKQLEEIRIQLERSHNLIVQTIKREGKIVAHISSVSKELHADLVVIGTHGKTGIQKITGSHAMKLINHLSVPVLVVQKRTFGMGYNKIVFPINIATHYDVKINWTISIAKSFRAEVFIYTMKTSDVQLKKALIELVGTISKTFEAHKIPVSIEEAQKTSGFPQQIIDYSVEIEADLIMIKVDTDEFEPSFILGALEEKMIFNGSQIPVFCAQKKED